MAEPHVWLKEAIEAAAEVTAWPVGMTGTGGPPFVVYAREGTAREQILADLMSTTPALDTTPPVATFTVGIYADDYVQAWGIAADITGAIHKFSGTAHGSTIDSCLVVDEKDGMADYLDGRDTPTYIVEITAQVRWQE